MLPGFGGCAVVVAMLLAATLGLLGLSNQLFWDDEANTAIYARNLLEFGRLTAWDGTNLLGYNYGGALGEDLGKELRVPGLPACVAAVGMFVFGETTFGGRIMFVAAGVLSVGLLAIWMRRFFGRRFPWYLPSLILALSPAYLLFIRNCRYYALGVTFTLLLWIVWVPAASSARSAYGYLPDRGWLLRCAGGAAAFLLLLSTHYLNAAAALLTLPVFFLDRRYRQPKQYVMLGVFCAIAVVYGIWLWVAANPFAADYRPPPNAPVDMHPWTHFYTNLGKLLRDLGTHEFVPWCLAPVLAVPWLAKGMRPIRRWARRGGILVAVVVVYAVTAAALTPSDMGKGPVAEIRYVVPLIAVGSALGAAALAVLWRLVRSSTPLGFLVPSATCLILLGTNLLHLGFLADRADQTGPWWPPTWYRYVAEVFCDYETGNEATIRLLRGLPDGTTVRIWPPHLVYPAMFYVPALHYCDQLKQSKRIRLDPTRNVGGDSVGDVGGDSVGDVGGDSVGDVLPEYLFVEESQAEVFLVASPFLRQKLAELYFRRGPDSHVLTDVLAPYWNYTSKPEIPARFFSAPEGDWLRHQGTAVLVRTGSPLADDLATDPKDADALCRLGVALMSAGQSEAAAVCLHEALQIDPDHPESHVQLGHFLMKSGENLQASKHLRAAVRAAPGNWATHLNLGTVLFRLRRIEPAKQEFLAALELKPDFAAAHYNLGNIALRRESLEEAIVHYRAAVRAQGDYPKAHVNWGNALWQQGKIREAMDHYRQALQIRPHMVQASVQLGIALHALGDKEAAAAEIRKALQKVPPDSPVADQIRQKLQELSGPE